MSKDHIVNIKNKSALSTPKRHGDIISNAVDLEDSSGSLKKMSPMSPRCQSRGCSREAIKLDISARNAHIYITDGNSRGDSQGGATRTLIKLTPM